VAVQDRRKIRPFKSPRNPSEAAVVSIPSDAVRDKRILWAIMFVLLAFGIFKAIVLWGAYPIPNPDFPGFIASGKSLLGLHPPESFKRAPAVGIMQVALSRVLPVANPELSAGWLLNAILSVVNGVLLFLIGRRFIGNLSALVAVVAMLNPWVLIAQVDPVAETTMLFFIFLSFWLMILQSRWVYLAAAIASMVRYECAALIAIAVVMDLLHCTTKQQRWRAIGLFIAASVPFLLWMLGTWWTWNPTASHYLKHYGHGSCIGDYLSYLGQSAFLSMFQWPPAVAASFHPQQNAPSAQTLEQSVQILSVVILALAGIGLAASLVTAVFRRNAPVLALWAFVFLYLPVHLFRAETHHRYTVPIAGLLLLLCCVGWMDLLKLYARISVPRWMPVVLAVIVAAIAVVWLGMLLAILPAIAKLYLKGRWLPYAGLAAIGAVWILEWFRSGRKGAVENLAACCLAAVAVVSVQFPAVGVIGNGTRVEFKRLADWYLANAKPGECLADRYAGTLRLIAPSRGDDFVNMARQLQSKTLEEFYGKCYNLNVRYVAWSPRGSAGTKQGLDAVGKILAQPRDYGPLRFVLRIETGPGQWIHVFRLLRPDEKDVAPPGPS
jgi:hypothetical protein